MAEAERMTIFNRVETVCKDCGQTVIVAEVAQGCLFRKQRRAARTVKLDPDPTVYYVQVKGGRNKATCEAMPREDDSFSARGWMVQHACPAKRKRR